MGRAKQGQFLGIGAARTQLVNFKLSIIQNPCSPPAMNTAMRTTLVLESVMVAMPLLVLLEEVRGKSFP